MTEFLDIDEVAGWLEPRGLLGGRPNKWVVDVDTSRLVQVRAFWTTESDLATMVLGGVIADFVANEQEVLLYVDDWAGSDSGQDLILFERFRQGLGETATVMEKPGHLFYPGEFVNLVSVYRLTLSLDWGTYLISSSGDLVIEILHDDWATLYAATPSDLDPERLATLDRFIEAHRGT